MMKQPAYWLAIAFTLLGVAALGVAGYLYWTQTHQPEPPKPAVTIEDVERSLESVVVGRHEVEYHIRNDALASRRVIGMGVSPETAPQFKPLKEETLDIPAKGSAVVKFVLQVNSPGPFEYKGTIYLDDAGFREVDVKVKG